MYLYKKHKLISWYNFDDRIYKYADKFFDEYKIKPNFLIFNQHTYEQICFIISVSPKRSGIQDDDGSEFVEISKFESYDYSMFTAINEELKDKEFIVMYDDENEDDDEDDGNIYIPNPFVGPEKEIINK